MITAYLKHLLHAKGAAGIHSPFIFEFYNKVLHDKRQFSAFDDIERLRAELLHRGDSIETQDYGAGGADKGTTHIAKKISEIAAKTSITKREGQLLFRIVEKYRPANILELGTSLGISTLYLAKGSMETPVITLEGSENVARIAKSNFAAMGARNIEVLTGKFDELLPTAITKLNGPVGLAFIDGNHRYESTTQYFKTLLQHRNENSIFIFHDINWSDGMQKAWHEIAANEEVTMSIDLFRMGIVFFLKGRIKQHFILKW